MARFRPDTEQLKRKLDEAQAEQPRSAGRPPWEPTPEQRKLATNLAGIGVTTVDIARILEISENTLIKHLLPELELGRSQANAVVAGKLFQQIQGGNFAAIQFWMRVKMGWVEPRPGDNTPEKEIEQLSDDELQREIEAVASRQRTASQARSLATRVQE